MDLQLFWFVLIGVLWAGYFLLEGFDFGVGMLLPFLPRSERERNVMFETIGPVWDGNEVWLVVAAGATFAAFPAWYATMFSGFYLALLLVLVCLIIRVVSFEWRGKGHSPRWRAVWTTANVVGSVGASFLWGVALANLVHGVPLDSDGGWAGSFADLFSAYTVFAGIVVVLLFAFHGATFLAVRTTGETKLGPGTEVPISEISGPYLADLRAGRNAVVQDLRTREGLPSFFRRLRDEGVRSIGMVPLVCRGELLGSLNVSFAPYARATRLRGSVTLRGITSSILSPRAAPIIA